MLLDEPLNALDPRHARDLMARLHDLSRAGAAQGGNLGACLRPQLALQPGLPDICRAGGVVFKRSGWVRIRPTGPQAVRSRSRGRRSFAKAIPESG